MLLTPCLALSNSQHSTRNSWVGTQQVRQTIPTKLGCCMRLLDTSNMSDIALCPVVTIYLATYFTMKDMFHAHNPWSTQSDLPLVHPPRNRRKRGAVSAPDRLTKRRICRCLAGRNTEGLVKKPSNQLLSTRFPNHDFLGCYLGFG